MAKHRARPRTERRKLERAARDLARDRLRLYSLGPGGAPEHATVVASASVVETQATSTPCPSCGDALRLLEHAARVVDGVRLREAMMKCQRCRTGVSVWFRLVETTLN